MLRWFQRKPTLPPFSKDNPGQGAWLRVGFSNAERNWEEEVHVAKILAQLLQNENVTFELQGDVLKFEHGLVVRPQIVEFQPRDDGAVRTVTTVEVNHPQLCPSGLFEYQHAVGQTPELSLQTGFQNWFQLDLPVFQDALRAEGRDLMRMKMEFPSVPNAQREVIFGPASHLLLNKPAAAEATPGNDEQDEDEPADEHDFCPCCLFTNCLDSFQEQLSADAFYGIRLFASRDVSGKPSADCRINGVDWPAGQEALLKYAAGWPARGWELRKQFVAIRTVPL
jgi:hypothetical protein